MSDENLESFEDFKANLDTSEETVTAETTEPTVSQTTETDDSDTATDTSVNPDTANAPELTQEEYDKVKKSYDELNGVYSRQGHELGQLRKFKQDFEPYLGYLKQIEQQQRQAQYEQNPDLKYQDMVQQELAPYREQLIDQETTKTVEQLEAELGTEAYNTLAPIMANALAHYQEYDPKHASWLAENPLALVRQAAGDYYLWQQKTGASPQKTSNPQRQKQAQSMAGVAKSRVNGQKTQGDMSAMNVNEMRDHLRKMGIAQRITE